MKAMKKLIFSLLTIAFSALVSIWALIWGWGLTPHNWTIIVWAPIIQFSLVVFQTIGASDDK